MIYGLIILFLSCCILLYWINKKKEIEPFVDIRLIRMFRIRVGVWYDKDYENMYEFVQRMSRFIPIDIVKYTNRYQPFYELKRRNVDLIFTNEKDYFVYWNNQQTKKTTILDSFKRNPQIQAITMAYYQYLLIPANYDKIIQSQDINDTVVSIPRKDTLGHDFMVDLLSPFKTHTVYRTENIHYDFSKMCKIYDIMMIINSHPNKLLLEYSNQKSMYLLDLNIFKPSKEYYDKYLFLNKKKIDLTYYPVMLQRYNSRNRLGSLLIDGSPIMDGYGIKTMLMGLDTINNDYITEFMKVYYMNIFNVIKKDIYFNNFSILEMSASRLAITADIVSFHEGARKFYTKIGNFVNNPNRNCAMLSNECTQDQLDAAGDYAQYEY
jgi:hypothetical protein